jgi:ribosomal protein L18E
MTTAIAQINIPFELLAEAVTTLNTEHKIKLWKLLGQEIAESQRITRSNVDTSVIDSLDRTVEKVLLETGLTEDELVEAFVNQES